MDKEIDKLNSEITIDGLHWIPCWRINNGQKDSFVIPFPTTYPVNIVYHGESEFKYGQYGIHLGQQDTLTFLGDEKQLILAKFIDCRSGSPTFKNKLEFYITPSSEKTLIIPPGVAHTFHNLENVFTLNSYKLLLPTLEQIYHGNMQWSPENDIINIPEDISTDDIVGYTPMTEEASDMVYHRIGEFQSENLKNYKYQHAETREFVLDDGKIVNLRLREKVADETKPVLPTSKIDGVLFRELPSIKTGKESCIVPLTRKSPLYLVEHGTKHYDFDSYGLHLGQEDHLTFLGSSTHKIILKLVDMREGSNTIFTEDEIIFHPSPNFELIIPCGVAHALINMANIITVNRPILYLDNQREYLPGHDVIDWPIENTNYMSYKTNQIKADDDFYADMVSKQREIIKVPPTHNTPKSVVVYDENTGKYVKVILKEKSNL
ncbi:dTDP-6-deoxy-D-glucose-3,5-epimerase [Photorhabdus luminescens]|uniref:dTDP-4-dehydrorhamnose 3,5-epimerase n=1 Tax=Photorhabdus luminescens subsp. mexicana TaxID=2100167 RepID=A0A4R4JQ19_PHOLU|nr:dTDP-4-dehydrorhamnose 3,5-epimerase family protein [Photorhabdus luminescens]OWO81390.1 dTDP-6-deoxy-D-glucose-3,5-epimerase [Photorhabdus luminescens]TDB56102.1 dTDP-6-deoxy-D-glucose-3,5-epimerase [Photorhabdus luminescens subsp. mexicana]